MGVEVAESDSSKLRRALRLILLLSQQKNGLSVYDLAKHEEIGPKTIRRDLVLLRDEGLPLEEKLVEHGKKLWRITAKVDQLSFTLHELLSLYMGRRLMEPFVGTPFFDGIHSLFRKLETQLFHESKSLQGQLADLIHLTNVGTSDYSTRSHLITSVMSSIGERHVLQMSYTKNGAAAPSSYMIQPYNLVYHRGSLYIIALSESSHEIRHFKLDRVVEMTSVSRSYEIPETFDVRRYLDESFGIFSPNGKQQRVRVHFASDVAATVKESQWHVSSGQKVSQNSGQDCAGWLVAEWCF